MKMKLKLQTLKTGKYNEIEFSSNYRQQLSLYKLLLQKKYDKEIKTYLYYLEEDKPKKEILIDDEDLKSLERISGLISFLSKISPAIKHTSGFIFSTLSTKSCKSIKKNPYIFL